MRRADRNRMIRLFAVLLMAGGFGLALLLTLTSKSAYVPPPEVAPPLPGVQTPVGGGGGTTTTGGASSGVLHVTDRQLAISVPFSSNGIPLARCDQVDIIVLDAQHNVTAKFQSLLVLRVTGVASGTQFSLVAPAGSQSAVILQVTSDQAPSIIGATSHSSAGLIQFALSGSTPANPACA